MVATKNPFARVMVALFLAAVFIVACSPPGPAALIRGKKFLDAGKMDAAIAELKTATSLLKTNAAAWNYLGVAYHRAGQWTNAVESYSQALRLNRELLEARFNLGCVWLEQNRPDAARTEFIAYTLRRPDSGEGFLHLGKAQMRLRDVAGAEKSFREALRLDARDVEVMNALGMLTVQQGKLRDAAELFTKAVKQQPDFRPALLNLGTVLNQLNDRPEALRRYREYLALQPREADWEAINAIAKSLEPVVAQLRAQSNAPLATNIVRTIAAQSKVASVTNAAKPVVSNPTSAPKPVQVVQTTAPPAAEVVKLPPEAVIKTTAEPAPPPVVAATTTTNIPAKPATVATPSLPKTNKTESRGLFTKLNPFKRDIKTNMPVAIVAVTTNAPSQAAIKTNDRRAAQQVLAAGQQAQRAGKLAEALQSYKRATQMDETYFEAQYSLGLAAFESRSFRVAAGAWEKAIALRPDSADARYNLALTLRAEGRFQEAADELEKLIALHPDEARGHLVLGNLYAEQLKDGARARRHYGRVLQLDPRNPQAQAIRYWLVSNPG
jgi:tetratricopeptide (TPR) repeat protein